MSCSRSCARSGERIPCEGVVSVAMSEPYRGRKGAKPTVRPPIYGPFPMHQGALIDDAALDVGKAFARELEDGQAVDSVFLVRERARREKRNGDVFLKLRLSDVTGTVEAVIWDGVDGFADATLPGKVVRVEGHFAVDSRYGGCITVRTIREAAEHEYDARDVHDGPPHPLDAMV